MRLYLCDQKITLRLHNQGVRFIKDYSTNTASAPRNAFIDAKGRVVAFFDQHRVDDDEIWAVMEKRFVDRLQKHLFKYLYITDTKIEPLENIRVYWDLESDADVPEGAVTIPQKAGRFLLTASRLSANVSEQEMRQFRLRHEIPWQGVDFDEEMILNVADEERVSYLKGCYLGQEVVARVHYKGRPPKRLVVKKARDCSPDELRAMTSRARDAASGEDVGFVFDKTGPEE